jgi:hypothetical protein
LRVVIQFLQHRFDVTALACYFNAKVANHFVNASDLVVCSVEASVNLRKQKPEHSKRRSRETSQGHFAI